MGNTGRNAFRLAGSYFVNLSLAKRTRIVGEQILELRADATNVTNHPNWGGLLNSSVATSSLFGRNRTPISNNARKVMLGVKYYF